MVRAFHALLYFLMLVPALLALLISLLRLPTQAFYALATVGWTRCRRRGWRIPKGAGVTGVNENAARPVRLTQPKPDWVRIEVLRLSALSGAGCRTIEKLFNRIYASSRKMTVSKSYVHYTVRRHRYDIAVLRRKIRHRPPRPVPVNQVWALDMTGKGDVFGQVHSMLGIVDHGSRRLLALESIERKNAWTLLGHVFLAIGRFGKPIAIRTDNEAVFRSRRFQTIMRLAAIRQQFTVPGCPWMNGRIERLFRTLKEKLNPLKIADGETLKVFLRDFRFWYNHVRPHHNLGGLTPHEAWHGIDPYVTPPKSAQWFEAWGGLLTGYYLRC